MNIFRGLFPLFLGWNTKDRKNIDEFLPCFDRSTVFESYEIGIVLDDEQWEVWD
jgi:hypothetical protein